MLKARGHNQTGDQKVKKVFFAKTVSFNLKPLHNKFEIFLTSHIGDFLKKKFSLQEGKFSIAKCDGAYLKNFLQWKCLN